MTSSPTVPLPANTRTHTPKTFCGRHGDGVPVCTGYIHTYFPSTLLMRRCYPELPPCALRAMAMLRGLVSMGEPHHGNVGFSPLSTPKHSVKIPATFLPPVKDRQRRSDRKSSGFRGQRVTFKEHINEDIWGKLDDSQTGGNPGRHAWWSSDATCVSMKITVLFIELLPIR